MYIYFPWFSVFSLHIPGPSVCISFFTLFSDFIIFRRWADVFIFHDFQFSFAIFHVLQWTFLNFPPFSVFLAYISRPKVCISHFPWFSVFSAIFQVLQCAFLIFSFSRFLVISLFFKSSSGMFLFSMIFSFLAIFHVLQWTFLNFPPFSVFLASIFPRPKVCISHFPWFSVFCHIPGPSVCISHFSRFLVISLFFVAKWMFSFSMIFSFLAIFHVLQWIFLNFSNFFFQFSSLIFHVLKCVFYFPWFSVFFLHSRSFSVHFSFFTLFSDFAIFQVAKWMFLIFHDFQFSYYIPRPTVDISKFSTFFQFSSAIFHVLKCVFSFSVIFSFLAIFQVLQCAFLIFHAF